MHLFEATPPFYFIYTWNIKEITDKIDEYMVADLKIGYMKKDLSFINTLKISLEFSNLFDEEYVSLINAMDDSRAGNTSYYVGAPFTTLLTVSLEI